MLSHKIQRLWKHVIENEQPIASVDLFEPPTSGRQADALIGMRPVWVVDKV
jgi:hypothetical protein